MGQTKFIRYEFEVPFGALAENLVNSYDGTHAPPEYLRNAADLRHFLEWHGLAGRGVTAAELASVRRVREQVRAVFEARSTAHAVNLVNQLLDDGASLGLQLEAKTSGVALVWHITQRAGVAARLRSAVGLNLAFLTERFGFERLRVCVAHPCRDVFVDVSKGGARRYCGLTCANRMRVAQFRRRQK